MLNQLAVLFYTVSGIVSVISQLLTEHANYRDSSRDEAGEMQQITPELMKSSLPITRLLEMGSDFSLFT